VVSAKVPETVSLPALIVVSPEKVLSPVNTVAPDPDFVKAPDPVIMPPYVKVVEESVFTVPFPVKVMPLLAPNVKVLVVFRVPPLKIILSASADPGVGPILALEEIEIVPADNVVDPV